MADFEERVWYRTAFSVARAIVNTRRPGGRVYDPDVARDVAEVRAVTLGLLSQYADQLPDEVLDQAVHDAIHRRPPRW